MLRNEYGRLKFPQTKPNRRLTRRKENCSTAATGYLIPKPNQTCQYLASRTLARPINICSSCQLFSDMKGWQQPPTQQICRETKQSKHIFISRSSEQRDLSNKFVTEAPQNILAANSISVAQSCKSKEA